MHDSRKFMRILATTILISLLPLAALAQGNAPPPIVKAAAATGEPLNLGLIIDSSPSMQPMLEAEKAVVSGFFRQAITDKDGAFIISFDAEATLEQRSTANLDRLH